MKSKRFFVVCAAALLGGAGQLFAAPVISSFTPTFGASSDPSGVIITGNGFRPGTLVVRFNGVQDTTAVATAADGTQIQARVPAGATNGANPIFVSVNGLGTYSSQDFTVIGSGPYISSFSPNIGGSGAAVMINGAHFVTPLAVYFNGLIAPGASAPTPTQISVIAPAGITTGPISVATSLGTYTSAASFYVPAILTGFSPTNGRPGTNVLITGTNFLGASAVRFNGLDAASFNVLSNRAILAVVPIAATTGPIRIVTPAGSVFTSSNFVVQPTVVGFSPAFGPVGTSVTVLGANFNVGTPVVKFSGVPAAVPTGVTFGQLTAVVPAGATNGPITVTTTNGTATSATNFFLPAVISSFAPSNSAPGTLVAIKGNNFTGISAVAFSGTLAGAFYVTNNTSLGALVPLDVTTGPITVTTPAGTSTSASNFYGVPVIHSFSPTRGLPGNAVTLAGQNFLGASAVRFNGSNAVFSVVDNTTISATVPANAPAGPISLTAPAGSTTSTQSFTLDYTANLSLTVTDTPDPVTVGYPLSYTIAIMNSGPFLTPGVILTDTLSATVTLIAASTTQGTLNTNANPVTGDLGQIGLGATVTVTLTVVPQAAGAITNYVRVTGQYPDPALANNSATNGTCVQSAQSAPILGVQFISPDQVRLAWPAGLTNYSLEFKSPITANDWAPVATPPVIVGNESQVTESNNQSPRYYRLHRSP